MRDAKYWIDQLDEKKISLEEYCIELDRKIQKVNPEINALVEWNLDQLLEDCKTAENRKESIFRGLPIPLKMLGQDKAGWKSTFGSKLMLENRAEKTSNFVKRLETIGFTPAGQTNTPEFGFKNITDASVYGAARNPWNLAHSPGGSSGGAAAAVAGGLFPIAGGSDGGGSIRIPASFSGLIGLKPTRGAMPTGPDNYRGWQGAAIDFALTVSMRDTEKLFYAMRGSDKAAPYHAPEEEWKKKDVGLPFRIAYFSESPVHSKVSDEAKKTLLKTVEKLEELGHQVTEISYPLDGIQLIKSYYLMNGAETSAMFDRIKRPMKRELTRDDMELITWGLYQYGEKVAVKDYIHALNLWDKACAVMENLFQTYDLIMTPATAYPAPRIDQELQSPELRAELKNIEMLSEKEAAELIYRMFEKSLHLSPFTQLANLTGQPAISLPVHVTADHLPMGVQFIASKGREDKLLGIGFSLEEQGFFKLPEAYL